MKSHFATICCLIMNATIRGENQITFKDYDQETVFICSVNDDPNTDDGIITHPAPLGLILEDIFSAFELEGWTVQQLGECYLATRTADAVAA